MDCYTHTYTCFSNKIKQFVLLSQSDELRGLGLFSGVVVTYEGVVDPAGRRGAFNPISFLRRPMETWVALTRPSEL